MRTACGESKDDPLVRDEALGVRVPPLAMPLGPNVAGAEHGEGEVREWRVRHPTRWRGRRLASA
eukprot:12544438-Alexandrium_andersonii.AAC.1